MRPLPCTLSSSPSWLGLLAVCPWQRCVSSLADRFCRTLWIEHHLPCRGAGGASWSSCRVSCLLYRFVRPNSFITLRLSYWAALLSILLFQLPQLRTVILPAFAAMYSLPRSPFPLMRFTCRRARLPKDNSCVRWR